MQEENKPKKWLSAFNKPRQPCSLSLVSSQSQNKKKNKNTFPLSQPKKIDRRKKLTTALLPSLLNSPVLKLLCLSFCSFFHRPLSSFSHQKIFNLVSLPSTCLSIGSSVAETKLLWGELEGAKAWQGAEIVLVRDFRSRARL